MKADDHFRKAEHFLVRQQRLDAIEDSEIITSTCHAAAHHDVCAALEWLGHDPQRYGHKHSKHPAALRDANAPPAIRETWQNLEELRNRGLYGGGVDQEEAEQARTLLLRIQAWVASCRP